MTFGPELRLAWAVLLSGFVFVCAYRLACSWSGERAQRVADAMLLTFAGQYAAVAVPGLLHVLSPWSMTVAALLVGAGMLAVARRRGAVAGPRLPRGETQIIWGIACFAAGFIAGIVYLYRFIPVIATDALTYHLPAAVEWLRQKRLAIVPTPFFNPANTYSPLAGSAFIAWWLAPIGSDVLARLAQVPPLALVFCGVLQAARAVGARANVAALLGAAAVVSRPFISEATLAKDDVYLAAFFIAAVAGLAPARLRDPGGPWRVGVALGLALATKYTALMTLPLLLLAIDAPFRAGWRGRQIGIALACVLVFAGPWYLRNWWLTGDPLYPVDVSVLGHRLFTGLFATGRSPQLRTASGVGAVLFGDYYSWSRELILLLVLGWLLALVTAGRRVAREPLARLFLLGPALGLGLFLATSPYAQVRFLFPALLLLFASLGMGWRRGVLLLASLLLVVATWTSFGSSALALVEAAAVVGVVVGLAGLGAAWVATHPRARRDYLLLAAGVGVVAIVAIVYVEWGVYVEECRWHFSRGPDGQPVKQDLAVLSWTGQYPEQAAAWGFIRGSLPEDATVAYANCHMIYPLYGYELRRRAVYVPARRGMERFLDLPRFPRPVADEEINREAIAQLNADPDPAAWLRRLRAAGATHLYVDKTDLAGLVTVPPPELAMAAADPKRFVPIFSDARAVVYRIDW